MAYKVLATIWLLKLGAIKCSIFNQIHHEQDGLGNIRLIISNSTEDTHSLRMLFSIDNKNKPDKKPFEIFEDCLSNAYRICYHYKDKIRLNVYKLNDHCQTINYTSSIGGSLNALIDFSNMHIYGGGEHVNSAWPTDKIRYERNSFVTKTDFYQAILEPYWLTSNGYYFYVDQAVPLFITLNPDRKFFQLTANNDEPYIKQSTNTALNFTVCKFGNARIAHMHAVNHFLGKPDGLADIRRVKEPIWSTWVRYKEKIDHKIVLKYAQDIYDHGFTGQVEIDDDWENCYGSLSPSIKKFPNLEKTIKMIKRLNFRVTLWVHPFVNKNCNPTHAIGVQNGFFVKNREEDTSMKWWRGDASYIDFTNPEAANWYRERLLILRNTYGIDSFKFDGGESGFSPRIANFYKMDDRYPETIVQEYVKLIASLGTNVHTRVGRATQKYPIFVTMMDRDSRWGKPLGLDTLVPQLLQFNILGYSFVLPDMIGGNFYSLTADDELYIRWLQANVFMPSMQFSVPPWDYGEDCTKLVKKFVDLHAKYADTIIALMKRNVETGEPVNPPLWWIDPNDSEALICDTEFLLGEDILVAPVLVEGARSRDIYLPSGLWKDENNGDIIQGGSWIHNYDADLTILPYFTRILNVEPLEISTSYDTLGSLGVFSVISISVLIVCTIFVISSLCCRCLKFRKQLLKIYSQL